MTRKILVLLVCAAMLSVGTSWAGRPDKSWKKWFGHVSAGYDFMQGDSADVLDNGWQLSGGATFWPEEWPIGIDLDLAYSTYDVSNSFVNKLNQELELGDSRNENPLTGGDASIWALTLDGMWSPGTGSVSFYLVGGLGAYYLDGRLNTTSLVYYPGYCGGWYWYYCSPGGVAPGDISVASGSTTEFGWNGGIGLSFNVGSTDSQLYLEAKYHSIEADRRLTYVPVSLGYRW